MLPRPAGHLGSFWLAPLRVLVGSSGRRNARAGLGRIEFLGLCVRSRGTAAPAAPVPVLTATTVHAARTKHARMDGGRARAPTYSHRLAHARTHACTQAPPPHPPSGPRIPSRCVGSAGHTVAATEVCRQGLSRRPRPPRPLWPPASSGPAAGSSSESMSVLRCWPRDAANGPGFVGGARQSFESGPASRRPHQIDTNRKGRAFTATARSSQWVPRRMQTDLDPWTATGDPGRRPEPPAQVQPKLSEHGLGWPTPA